MLRQESEYLAPAVGGLLGAVRNACRVEKGMAGAVVAMEFVALAELLEQFLGAVDVVAVRVLVVIAEDAEQGRGELLGVVDRRDRLLVVELLLVIDDDIAAPAIDHGVEARHQTAGEIGLPSARAEADDADLAR